MDPEDDASEASPPGAAAKPDARRRPKTRTRRIRAARWLQGCPADLRSRQPGRQARRRGDSSGGERKPRKRRGAGRSLLGHAVYWSAVLGLWA